jgi:molybdopterin-containing oxidoreductase family iron-sulfur binding subunit
MSRLYVVESTPTSTGAKADQRLPLRAVDVEGLARGLAAALGVGSGATLPAEQQAFVTAVAKDLQAHRGASLVVAGDHLPPAVHALVHAINQALGNAGKTVVYTDPVLAQAGDASGLKDLVAEIRGGKVDQLFILGGNPVYDAPADFGFADALKNSSIPLRIYHGLYQNETSDLCHWHINEAHYLEAWGDGRAYDGTVSIVQPLIAPLYGGKSIWEMASLLNGQSSTPGYEIIQGFWKKQHPGADFEAFWRKALHDGWVEGTAFAPRTVSAKAPASSSAPGSEKSIEINFRRDPSIYDGTYSNNGWLQELPKPMTKMTWDNPVLVGPAMAERLGLASEDLVTLTLNGKAVTAPVWVQAGHADNSITVFLGYGRRRAGRVGTGAGFDMYALRYSATPWIATGVTLAKAGGKYKLATTQGYQTMETPDGGSRPLVRTASLEEYHEEPVSPARKNLRRS